MLLNRMKEFFSWKTTWAFKSFFFKTSCETKLVLYHLYLHCTTLHKYVQYFFSRRAWNKIEMKFGIISFKTHHNLNEVFSQDWTGLLPFDILSMLKTLFGHGVNSIGIPGKPVLTDQYQGHTGVANPGDR